MIPHHLSHLVGIACFKFSRNLLLSFSLLFLPLLVIDKQVYLFFWNLNVQYFTLFIRMGQFSIWPENVFIFSIDNVHKFKNIFWFYLFSRMKSHNCIYWYALFCAIFFLKIHYYYHYYYYFPYSMFISCTVLYKY